MDPKLLQKIRDKLLGVTESAVGGLNTSIYLQQIRDAVLGVTREAHGNLNEVVYLQQIRNAIKGVPDGQFGSLAAHVYLQEIRDAFNSVTSNPVGSMDEDLYLSEIYPIASTTPLTVTIASTETSPSAVLPIPIAFTLSEISTDFTVGDLTLVNCTVANFAGSGTSYTCEATPSTPNATFTINIAANAFHDAAGNGNVAATQFSFTSSAFLLADEFTDTVAPGAVNGTTATPTGGTRTATDTNSKLSIGAGVLNFATGGVGAADPSVWYPAFARRTGQMLFAKTTPGAGGGQYFGWDTNQAGIMIDGILLRGGASLVVPRIQGTGLNAGAIASGTTYYTLNVQRANGFFFFIKGGAFTNWTLLYTSVTGNNATMNPGANAFDATSIGTFDFIRIPSNLAVLTPLASDAFTRANGALGNTGGGGAEESGGSGLAWTAQLGTWGIATNKAASSAVDVPTGVSIATVPCGTQNIVAEIIATRAAGTSGLCLRYTDSSNYIKCVHNGTNLQVIEVVAGTPNTLVNTAATYGAAFRMVVSLNGTKVRAFYNNTAIGVEVTTAIATGNNHGLFTDDTGATFDNFVVWAKGNGGEYETLFNKYINP